MMNEFGTSNEYDVFGRQINFDVFLFVFFCLSCVTRAFFAVVFFLLLLCFSFTTDLGG